MEYILPDNYPYCQTGVIVNIKNLINAFNQILCFLIYLLYMFLLLTLFYNLDLPFSLQKAFQKSGRSENGKVAATVWLIKTFPKGQLV